ncbi:S8 family serine peptidase [Streptacidiphilus jiangxiensis]|uniref:S8 family serine peptidase n=1 Tax=Streptacidiphilus jiangxiensis TaxID=235985 RepID=UPI000A99AFB9|nr:S8 family serine peptidase [Streptacidiphilus jiangxiensis]
MSAGWTPAAHADQARDAQWMLADYQAPQTVWPHSTGKGVTVAVIDSGVRASHMDLRGQVLPGTDFAFGGNGQTDHSAEGHGTGMASIIAGHGRGSHGADGVMGLAPGAKILPVGIGGSGQVGFGVDYVPQAIRYAVDHGARVICLSLGTPSAEPAQEAAVAYAEQHDVVLVAAAGNDGTTRKEYPASWPGVVKVGAVDERHRPWSGSNRGGVTVAAPGVHMVRDGAASDTQVVEATGTSDSTAVVAAIAALYRSAHPQLTAGQTIDYILETAVRSPDLSASDPALGHGIARPDLGRVLAAGPAAGPLPQATDPTGGAWVKASAGADAGGGAARGRQPAPHSAAEPGAQFGTWLGDAGPGGIPRGVVYGVLAVLAGVAVVGQIVLDRRRRRGAEPVEEPAEQPDAAFPSPPACDGNVPTG